MPRVGDDPYLKRAEVARAADRTNAAGAAAATSSFVHPEPLKRSCDVGQQPQRRPGGPSGSLR